MSYTIKAIVKKEGDFWSGEIPSLSISTTSHKTLEACINTLTPLVAKKVSDDFDSPYPIKARVDSIAVKLEYEIEIDHNHHIDEFIPQEPAKTPPAAEPQEPLTPAKNPDCHSCEFRDKLGDLQPGCVREGDLIFKGGSLTDEQILRDVQEFSCHGHKPKEGKKLKIGSPELKEKTAKVNRKKPDKPVKVPTDTVCHACEAADICTSKDPHANCLREALEAETERIKKKNAKGKKKSKGAPTDAT
jgi:hypothetical protein